MTSLATPTPTTRRTLDRARRFLSGTGAFWFIAALIGQAIFALYIFVAFWFSAARGDWDFWNRHLFTGIRQGDLLGNALVVLHLTLALIITISGPLQLIPALRQRMRAFHRWNGRAYMMVAIIISIGAIGIFLLRPAFGGPMNAALQSVNGLAILLCAGLAWRAAIGRDYASRRRWATRLFLMVSGVWFLRVMMIAWAIPTGGLGLGDALDGPVGRAAMLGQTIIPLAVYQLYLMAEASRSAPAKYLMGGALILLTAVMAAGILGVSLVMWLPTILG
ncbi:MAG: DUF2306 domain-containing protein [Hyphomonas sp.]